MLGMTNQITPSVLLDSIIEDFRPTLVEQRLWIDVIIQAIFDSTNTSKKTHDKVARTEAIRWLKGQSHDFRTVCELADINANHVIGKVMQITPGNKPYRRKVE